MIALYETENRDVHKKAEILIVRELSAPFEIRCAPSGKPYIEGDPLFFSLSHSGDRALIALCDKPVGVDLELDCGGRGFSHILARFTEREKAEIGDSAEKFFVSWTAKEAYIKMTGGTLARDLKRTEYFGGSIRRDGRSFPVAACPYRGGGVYALCAEGYALSELLRLPIQPFALRRGEKL